MLLSLFMPWASAGIFSIDGVETEDGKVFLVLAGLAILCSALELTANSSRGWSIAGMVVAALAVALSIYEISNISGLAEDSDIIAVRVGSGLYVGLAGSVAFGIGAIEQFKKRALS